MFKVVVFDIPLLPCIDYFKNIKEEELLKNVLFYL